MAKSSDHHVGREWGTLPDDGQALELRFTFHTERNMKKLVFALLGMPLFCWVASASTVYTFTLQTVRGPIGFTYVAPEPLSPASTTYVNSWMLAGCETTGAPGWICLDAYLRQTTINGLPVVQITLDLAYPPGLGDGFATDQLNESFPVLRSRASEAMEDV